MVYFRMTEHICILKCKGASKVLRLHYTKSFITSDFAARVPSQNTSDTLSDFTDRSFLKTVYYPHVISLNIHTVYNKVKNGCGRRGYHCASQHPPVDGLRQFSELKFHSVSYELYNSQSCCICLYVGLSVSFLSVFFWWHGRMGIHRGVHGVNVYQT